MRTVAAEAPAEASAPRTSFLQRFLPAAAGPALIVACVLFAMRGLVFRNFLSGQHPDILAFWLPRFCYLGQALRAGHVPVWNPLQFAGIPFAADPQSGWLYAPPMALFSTLSCGTALRMMIVLQPLLAGLGLHWFLRTEQLHRAAATAGGLSAAMMISTSGVGLSLPFDAMLAWLPFVLVGAGGFLRASSLPRRLGWLALGALAWGQVASAHMSHGLVLATLATAVYILARCAHQVRRGTLRPWHAVALLAGFWVFVLAANLAILLPRMALFSRSSLRGGYAAIGGAAAAAAGLTQRPLSPGGFWSAWPLAFGSAPGSYAGAVILLAVPLAARASRRFLTYAFAGAGLLCYVLTLDALAGARWFRDFVLTLPYGDVYLHNVSRLRYLLFLVIPVLGALGIQSLIERPLPPKRVALWIGAGAALWLGVPLVAGAHPVRLALLAAGTAVAVPVFVWLSRRPKAAVVLVVVLALELMGSAAWSQVWNGKTVYFGLEQDESGRNLMPQPLLWPTVSVSRYLTPGPIARTMQRHPGRYNTWDQPEAQVDKGYLYDQTPPTWPALENTRGMLFGIPDSMGYSPVQLTRYWSWVHAVNATPVFYNAAVLHHPTARDLRMLAVRYLIVRTRDAPPVPGRRVTSEGRYTLYEITGNPTASLVSRWSVVPDGPRALRAVTDPAFDPRSRAILVRDPGITQNGGPTGSVTYRRVNPQEIVLHTDTTGPELLVVHDSFDHGWTYSVDGSAPAQVLAADYFLQGVPVPGGSHTVVLRYSDPRIGQGLLASAMAWGLLIVAIVVSVVVRRRRERVTPSSGASEAPPR
jgi:hypothetical protein